MFKLLNLCLVTVLFEENIAQYGTASLSDILWNNEWSYGAEIAIDGDTDLRYYRF